MEITAKTKAALMSEYVAFVDNKSFCFVEPKEKQKFHRESKKILRIVAQELDYQAGNYEIRVNKGDLATSGSITLTSSTLYISIQGAEAYRGIQILFRSRSRPSATHQAPIHSLKDLSLFIRRLKAVSETGQRMKAG